MKAIAGIRARTLVAGVIALAMVLGGCASMPEAGAPQPFSVSVPNTEPIDLAAGGPLKGSSTQALISDFLLACAAGPTDDFATARLYLTPEAGARWRPAASVQIYATDSIPLVDEVEAGVVVVSAPAVASVNERGQLTRTEDRTRLDRRFTLAAINGEWRIASLDDGIVLSQATFEGAYQRAALYFPAPTGDALIPDPRWYPRRRLATHLLNGLIAGPSDSIAAAVVSAIPEGATVPSQSVDIADRIAHVALNAPQPADADAQRLLVWQVSSTLTQASSVQDVRVAVSGQVIEVGTLPEGPTYRMDSAIALGPRGLVQVTGTATNDMLSNQPVGPSAAMPAIGPVADAPIAWTDQDRVLIESAVGTAAGIHPLLDPTWPTVDRLGWTWATQTSSPSAGVSLMKTDGTTGRITSPFQDASTVSVLRVSPDGARAVFLRHVGDVPSVWIAPIVRDANGVPTAFGTATQVESLARVIVDVSWSGNQTLAVLKEGATAGARELAVVPLGALVEIIAAPDGAVHVTGGRMPSAVYVSTDEGAVFQRSGSVWQAVEGELKDIQFPG